jgi:hypothetical protein
MHEMLPHVYNGQSLEKMKLREFIERKREFIQPEAENGKLAQL